VVNGVRQDAILSPILFYVCFDVLLNNLDSSGIGLSYRLFFRRCISLRRRFSVVGSWCKCYMRSMLHTCDLYATQYNVLFNASKSKCICCHPISMSKLALLTLCFPSFFTGLQPIDFVEKWPHLGHIISNDCDDFDDLCTKKISRIGQVNKILCTFHNVDCSTKTILVKSYCTSFYGAEIWDLCHSGIEVVCIAWRKGIRRIWRLPNTTHSALIPELCGTMPLVDLFYKRMLNLVYRCLNSQSSLVKFVARFGILSGRMDSVVGRNVLNCSLRFLCTTKFVNVLPTLLIRV
jgi:hypothetical protein